MGRPVDAEVSVCLVLKSCVLAHCRAMAGECDGMRPRYAKW